jgi:hypothetical protein
MYSHARFYLGCSRDIGSFDIHPYPVSILSYIMGYTCKYSRVAGLKSEGNDILIVIQKVYAPEDRCFTRFGRPDPRPLLCMTISKQTSGSNLWDDRLFVVVRHIWISPSWLVIASFPLTGSCAIASTLTWSNTWAENVSLN